MHLFMFTILPIATATIIFDKSQQLQSLRRNHFKTHLKLMPRPKTTTATTTTTTVGTNYIERNNVDQFSDVFESKMSDKIKASNFVDILAKQVGQRMNSCSYVFSTDFCQHQPLTFFLWMNEYSATEKKKHAYQQIKQVLHQLLKTDPTV